MEKLFASVRLWKTIRRVSERCASIRIKPASQIWRGDPPPPTTLDSRLLYTRVDGICSKYCSVLRCADKSQLNYGNCAHSPRLGSLASQIVLPRLANPSRQSADQTDRLVSIVLLIVSYRQFVESGVSWFERAMISIVDPCILYACATPRSLVLLRISTSSACRLTGIIFLPAALKLHISYTAYSTRSQRRECRSVFIHFACPIPVYCMQWPPLSLIMDMVRFPTIILLRFVVLRGCTRRFKKCAR